MASIQLNEAMANTYQNDLPKEKMAEVCMENYGLSILARAIPLVIAGSLGIIFSRNSINNAFVSLEIPRLVERLRESFKDDGKKPLIHGRLEARVGCPPLQVCGYGERWHVWEQKVSELPPSAQEIISFKGLGNWVKFKIQA